MTQRNLLPCLLVSLLLLAGCNKENAGAKDTQVIAKVNGEEISVHQLNAAMPNLQGLTPEAVAKLRRDVLDKLIRQQLAYEQAKEKKLDRNPKVMLEVESAKKEIVARAYVDQLASALPKPTDDDVSKYYVDNPALFSNRHVYSLQELSLGNDPAVVDEIKRMIAAGRSIEEIGNWMKSKSIPFRAGVSVRPAEEISLETLPRIAELKEGQMTVVADDKGTSVVRVVASQAAPISAATAKDSIRAYLYNVSAKRSITQEMDKLRADAKIELKGEFSGTETAVAKPAAPVAAPADNAGVMEKGVAGLKK